jgi:hypothetical protein
MGMKTISFPGKDLAFHFSPWLSAVEPRSFAGGVGYRSLVIGDSPEGCRRRWSLLIGYSAKPLDAVNSKIKEQL